MLQDRSADDQICPVILSTLLLEQESSSDNERRGHIESRKEAVIRAHLRFLTCRDGCFNCMAGCMKAFIACILAIRVNFAQAAPVAAATPSLTLRKTNGLRLGFIA